MNVVGLLARPSFPSPQVPWHSLPDVLGLASRAASCMPAGRCSWCP